ncbi:MAG: DUF6398 domain-containing protein [bacterium]|nr:DUF6398 domain-containing protein [bacterium]
MDKSQNISIPKKMRAKYDEITEMTDKVCKEYLDDEYAGLAQEMTASLARKRTSPLETGKAEVWACGIVYALGRINFLFDKAQTPYMKQDELCALFGVKQRTASTKASAIMDMLNTMEMDPRWCRISLLDDNPLVWLYQTSSGFIIDLRDAPRDIQEQAFKAGLIPYIPDDRENN